MIFKRYASVFFLGTFLAIGCGPLSNDNSHLSDSASKASPYDVGNKEIDDVTLPDTWTYNNKWSLIEEEQYQKWIQQNYTADFYTKRNLWADCADAEMIRKAWYSIKRGLPFGYRPIYDTNYIVSSLDLGSKKPIEFIKNMRDAVSTKNLMFNSFRIKIADNMTKNLRPGIFHLYSNQHTMPIADIDQETGLLTIRDSTLTTRPITLSEHPYFEAFPTQDSSLRRQFTPIIDSNGKLTLGFLEAGLEQIGAYNDGQIDFSRKPFFEWIQQLVLGLDERQMGSLRETTVKKLLDNYSKSASARIPTVNEGYDACRDYTGPDPLLCTDSHEGTHSTPGRDGRLRGLSLTVNSYRTMLQKARMDNLVKWMDEYLLTYKISYRVTLKINDAPKEFLRTINLKELSSKSEDLILSPNPKDPVQERWGDNIKNLISDKPEEHYLALMDLQDQARKICGYIEWRNQRVYSAWSYCARYPQSQECRDSLAQLQQDDQWYTYQISQYLRPSQFTTKIDANLHKAFYGYVFQHKLAEGMTVESYKSEMLQQCFISHNPYAETLELPPYVPRDEKNIVSALEFYNSYSQGRIRYQRNSTWFEFWGRSRQ